MTKMLQNCPIYSLLFFVYFVHKPPLVLIPARTHLLQICHLSKPNHLSKKTFTKCLRPRYQQHLESI